MKNLKRIFVFLLATLLVSTNSLLCFASVSPSAAEVKAGETATVVFDYKQIAGIRGTLDISGDDIVKNVDVKVNADFYGEYKENTGVMAFFAVTKDPSDFLFTVKLTLKDSAKPGDQVKVTFVYESTVDGKLPSQPVYSSDVATVTIGAPTAPTVNYDRLNALIAQAQGLKKDDYTADSWNKLQTALDAAIAALSSKDQAVVDAAANALDNAIKSLVEKETPPAIDYSELNKLIAEAQLLNENEYTADSWAKFKTALDNAIAARTATKQSVVDAAVKALSDAMKGLVKKPVAPVVNYDRLNALIAQAQGLKEDDYTADSWSKLQTALATAIAAKSSTDQAVVDAAANALDSAIKGLVKKPVAPTVNYDRLNALIAQAQGLTKDDYTVDSWSKLETALNAATAALSSKDQAVVDAAANALDSAIKGLVKKPVVPPVNYDELKALIEEAKALNKDDYTEESWANLEIALDIAEAALTSNQQSVVDAAVKALSDAMNGLVKKPVNPPAVNYDRLNALIEAAKALNKDEYTQESWTNLEAALENAIAALASTKQSVVDAAANDLQDAINNLVKKQPTVAVNYDELNKAIEEAKKLNKDDYTADSWAKLETALDNAVLAKTSNDQAVVDAAVKALYDAINGLVRKPAPVVINYDQLNKLIEAAQKLNKNDYTADSWAKLESALKNAIAAREATEQSIVDAAAKALQVAISNLVKKQPVTSVNYDKLNALIEAALALNKDDYTEESWARLEAALDDAVIAKTSKSQTQVDAAAKALEDAINALVKKPTESSDGEIDYSKLNEQIAIAEKLNKDDYTKESWNKLEAALAKAIEARKATTQAEVDEATAELKDAIAGLEEAKGFPWWIILLIILVIAVAVVVVIYVKKRSNKRVK